MRPSKLFHKLFHKAPIYFPFGNKLIIIYVYKTSLLSFAPITRHTDFIINSANVIHKQNLSPIKTQSRDGLRIVTCTGHPYTGLRFGCLNGLCTDYKNEKLPSVE